MSSTPSVNAALANAKRALDNANNFTKNVVKQSGGTEDAFKSKEQPKAAASNYTHARAARKVGDSFLGVRSNEAPEINTALKAREDAKKALEQ